MDEQGFGQVRQGLLGALGILGQNHADAVAIEAVGVVLPEKLQSAFVILQVLADFRHSNVERLLADAGVGILVQKRTGFFQQFQGAAQFGVVPFVQPKCLIQHGTAVDDDKRIGILFQCLFGFFQTVQVLDALAVPQAPGGGIDAVVL